MITATLIYLSIGSLVWLVLDWTGVIGNTQAQTSARAMVLASLMMIALWPWFVISWVKGMLRA